MKCLTDLWSLWLSVIARLAALCLLPALASCYYDSVERLKGTNGGNSNCSTATFTSEVMPIITRNCSTSGCHDVSAAGGVSLLGYNDVKTHMSRIRQRAIVDGNMPPSGPLSSAELQILKCWMDTGGLNN